MINFDDPDYKAAGQFYALVKSVSIKCADPQKPGVNMTSYRYGTNATANTPTVAFSNSSTLLNGAGVTAGISIRFHSALLMTVAGMMAMAML